MTRNRLVRQTHRWFSVAFTVSAIANIFFLVFSGQEQFAVWVGLSAGLPLALLLFTGLYLFVLPYVARWRGEHGAADSASPEGTR